MMCIYTGLCPVAMAECWGTYLDGDGACSADCRCSACGAVSLSGAGARAAKQVSKIDCVVRLLLFDFGSMHVHMHVHI